MNASSGCRGGMASPRLLWNASCPLGAQLPFISSAEREEQKSFLIAKKHPSFVQFECLRELSGAGFEWKRRRFAALSLRGFGRPEKGPPNPIKEIITSFFVARAMAITEELRAHYRRI